MMEIGAYIQANREALMAWGAAVCDEICSTHRGLLKVPPSVRVKDESSARAKQIKKSYADPIKEMTDLVGVRFVVLTSSDIEPICSSLQCSKTWRAEKARDPALEIEKDPDTFGYQSYHYEVRPADSQRGDWCCEVQVRTLLQHAIAELSHDAMYKATIGVPSKAKRLVARSMALMETTDELLCQAIAAVREAAAPALAMRRVADQVTQSVDGASDPGMLEDLLSAFSEDIEQGSADGLHRFVRDNDFILGRIRDRHDEGIFGYPATAVVAYWLVDRLERTVFDRWPFSGSLDELKKMFSDLGKSLQY